MNIFIFSAIYATTDLVPHIFYGNHKNVMLTQFTDTVACTQADHFKNAYFSISITILKWPVLRYLQIAIHNHLFMDDRLNNAGAFWYLSIDAPPPPPPPPFCSSFHWWRIRVRCCTFAIQLMPTCIHNSLWCLQQLGENARQMANVQSSLMMYGNQTWFIVINIKTLL